MMPRRGKSASNLSATGSITVKDLLDDPSKYHGQCCKDPHEPDYGNSTIAKIYSDQDVPIIHSHAHGGIKYRITSNQTRTTNFSTDDVLDQFYLVVYNKKDEIYRIVGNKIENYSVNGFKHKYGCYKVVVTDGTNQSTMKMTDWWLGNPLKKCIAGDGFSPDKPIVYEKYGELVLNEYVPEILKYGFPVPSLEEQERCSALQVSHIMEMIHAPAEAEIYIQWLANLIQNPAERPTFAPLIISQTRGVGKDMITNIFGKMLGHDLAKTASIKDLSNGSGQGNAFYHTKLIVISECGSSTDRFTVGNEIKDSITMPTKSMNLKGKSIITDDVYCGMIFYSNSLSPFCLDEGDRRFFVTRCDWTAEDAKKREKEGYFSKLANFYKDPVHLHGLYHWLLNKEITINMKGNAPMTSTKEIIMTSEHNETEQFFIDLKNHPCKYWTVSMVDSLFDLVVGNRIGNKQYNHYKNQMINIKKEKIKIHNKSYRLKTFTMILAENDHDFIKKNINEN